MKKEKYQNYIAIGLTAFLVIAACIVFFFLMFRLKSIWSVIKRICRIIEPFFIGAVIAYLVAPLYNLLMRNLEPAYVRALKPKRAHNLAVASALTVSLLALLFVLFGIMALVIPRFVNSVIGIVDSLEVYSNRFLLWLNTVFSDNPDLAEDVEEAYKSISSTVLNWLYNTFTPSMEAVLDGVGNLTTVLSGVISGVKIVVRVFKDAIIGFIVSAYLLVSKRHLIAQAKKITYSLVRRDVANYLLNECRYIHTVFGGFIRGKLVDSLIMGVLCYIGCVVFAFPFPIVVGVIVGITNVIPFFGPFIGAIPCGMLILLVSPIKCVYFVIFILALQQLDGNVIGPKILGDATGLSSFWVLFAVVLFGGVFGFVGMVIAVPLFAVIYSLISAYTNHLLKKKGLSLHTGEYELLQSVSDEGDYVHMKDPTKK